MSQQQITLDDLLRSVDDAPRFADEQQRRHDGGILRNQHIAATNAAINANAIPASGFNPADVGDEIFRCAEGIKIRFCVDVHHAVPHVAAALKDAGTILVCTESDFRKSHINFARDFQSICSDGGTCGAAS